MTDDQHEEDKDVVSRRRFIKNTGMITGGVVGGSLLGGLFTNQFLTKDESEVKSSQTEKADESLQDARMFFSRSEDFDILSAATERIYPEDDNGPGAIELGVPYFIDKQLAGAWGTNAKDYMRDPFQRNKQVEEYEHMDRDQDKSGPNTSTHAPTPTPRYQTRLNRGELFIKGLRKMDQLSQETFGEKFVDIAGDEQDEILAAFENGEVTMESMAGITFFNYLLQTTIEGVYADPVYGGNKNMMAWKMKEYPGPRMAYINEIDAKEFIEMEPKSLRDYQGGG